ncbi:MAG: tetratricopeptide repeat protein, partial [Verrucomicrobiota bacterium]
PDTTVLPEQPDSSKTPVVVEPADALPQFSQSEVKELLTAIGEAVETEKFPYAVGLANDLLRSNPANTAAVEELNAALTSWSASPVRLDDESSRLILEVASNYDPEASRLLLLHYQKTGNADGEIASLIKLAPTEGAYRYREAGDRLISDEPDSEDLEQAFQYFLLAATQGDAGAQYRVAESLIYGKGCPVDYERGEVWLQRAIKQGDDRAMNLLGLCYLQGWGMETDREMAVKLFTKSVEKGNPRAHFNLGARFAKGEGIARNPARAHQLFYEGAKLGNPESMLMLARTFEKGFGVARNLAEAENWYQEAAARGNFEAQRWRRRAGLSD